VEFRLVDSIGFSFSKDFLAGHFKKFQKFPGTGPKTAGGKVISAGDTAATTILREGHESLDRAPRSGLIVGHAA
jgi:hypothetical protein